MNTTAKKTGNKAALVAAVLIMTLSIAVFGTFADESSNEDGNNPKPFHQELTDEQKDALQEAKELFKAGDKEAAKALMEEAGIKHPKKRAHKRANWFNNLTEEQQEVVKEAKELFKAGDKEAAKALLEDAGIEHPKGKKGKRGCHKGEHDSQD